MKIIGVYLFLFLLAIGMTFGLNLLLGIPMTEAIQFLNSQSYVLELSEIILIILFLLSPFLQVLWHYIKKKRANQ